MFPAPRLLARPDAAPAPPPVNDQPITVKVLAPDGSLVMTGEDILAGKGGFQKADLMDYGSIYGMGSYYGEDYTASALVAIGTAARDAEAQARFGHPFATLPEAEAVAATVQSTRRLARYQRKWLRRLAGAVRLDGTRPAAAIADEILALGRTGERLPRR